MGGSRAKAETAREMANELEAGACSVRVGVVTYSVIGQPGSTVPHQESDTSSSADTAVTEG